MAKLYPLNIDGKLTGYMIFCPACQCGHLFNTVPGPNGVGGQKPVWDFDGNMEEPTFSPSMKCTTHTTICHSFVTKGKIQFCGDCTHSMAGKTVELPDF